MATTNNPKHENIATPEKAIEQYITFVEDRKSRPGSIFEFAQHFGFEKEAIQKHYKTIAALEITLWKSIIEETFKRLDAEPAYADYVARERLLAFYFTLFEVLKPYREYIKLAPINTSVFYIGSDVLSGFKQAFKNYIQQLVSLGLETGEVEKRNFITDKYHEALWAQCLFLLNFWVKDSSEDFQKTDEAVERSVNLSLDLMARGPLDSLLEFGQFLFKNR